MNNPTLLVLRCHSELASGQLVGPSRCTGPSHPAAASDDCPSSATLTCESVSCSGADFLVLCSSGNNPVTSPMTLNLKISILKTLRTTTELALLCLIQRFPNLVDLKLSICLSSECKDFWRIIAAISLLSPKTQGLSVQANETKQGKKFQKIKSLP